MGVDFLKSKAKSFVKRWDECRRSLASASLFVGEPEMLGRRYLAVAGGTTGFQPGERLLGQLDGEVLRLSRRGELVGRTAALPLHTINQLRNEGCEVAMVIVHSANPISGTAEISLS